MLQQLWMVTRTNWTKYCNWFWYHPHNILTTPLAFWGFKIKSISFHYKSVISKMLIFISLSPNMLLESCLVGLTSLHRANLLKKCRCIISVGSLCVSPIHWPCVQQKVCLEHHQKFKFSYSTSSSVTSGRFSPYIVIRHWNICIH